MKRVNHLANLCLSLLLASCAITPKVSFENYVDTRSKPIFFQEKQTFSFDEVGVYFSNEFNGARLNSVEQLNDSTYQIGICQKMLQSIQVHFTHLRFGAIANNP